MVKILSRKKRIKQAILRAIDKHGKRYDYSKVDFNRQSDFVTIVCKEHGDFEQRFHSHLSGSGCPKCGIASMRKNKSSSSESLRKNFVRNAKRVHGDYYDYSKVDYTGKTAKDKVTIIHPILGEFEQTYGNHITLKHHHPKHYLTVGRKEYIEGLYGSVEDRQKQFKESCKLHHKGEYKYPKLKQEFTGYTSRITVVCPRCGPTLQLAHNHMRGHGCKKCSRSCLEKKVANWIESLLPNETILLNDRVVLDGKELDIYIPNKQLAIKIGGVYWHQYSKVGKYYHQEKYERCKDKGIVLITIFDSDWNDKRKRLVIKSRIRAKLGVIATKIAARKCEIKAVSGKDAKKFIDENHLQGYSGSTVNYGLIYNDKLVSLITFRKPRYNKNFEWEIIRFCSKKRTIVQGAFTKLLSHFIKCDNPNSIITYADLRWGEGNMYASVFTFSHRTDPSPWYTFISGKERIFHRSTFMKKNLPNILNTFDETKSAEWNIVNNNYVRIYDCGNAVYTWRKK